jgi:hypothetical protein
MRSSCSIHFRSRFAPCRKCRLRSTAPWRSRSISPHHWGMALCRTGSSLRRRSSRTRLGSTCRGHWSRGLERMVSAVAVMRQGEEGVLYPASTQRSDCRWNRPWSTPRGDTALNCAAALSFPKLSDGNSDARDLAKMSAAAVSGAAKTAMARETMVFMVVDSSQSINQLYMHKSPDHVQQPLFL